MHEHECDRCHTVWAHGDESFNNEAAHRCPNCGTVQWNKRLGEACAALFALLGNLLTVRI
jgi:predicted  nucleic acid-binding Zn-ribbon protein